MLATTCHSALSTRARVPVNTPYARNGVAFVRDFLPQGIFEEIVADCRSLRGNMKREKNSIALGRLGRMVDRNSITHARLTSESVVQRVSRLAGQTLVPSEYPIEMRVYTSGACMDWHKDDEMYDMPQLEMVYCLENTSDSETEWIIDGDEGLCSEWTPPNSALLVRAGESGARHRVRPLRRGERTILKLIWHSPDSVPIDRFWTHMDSFPGLRSGQRPKATGASSSGGQRRRNRKSK